MALGSSLTAAGFCMQYWFPQIPVWIGALVFCCAIYLLNVISTRFFAEGEFWFSLIKVVTIVAFIVLGGAAMFGFIPMKDGTPASGLEQSDGARLAAQRRTADSDDHGGSQLRLFRHRADRYCGR